jgi:purine nucleoside permease
MVLRTASNTCEAPPGIVPTSTIGDEAPGQITAFEASYRVGVPVVHELLRNWQSYENAIPAAP